MDAHTRMRTHSFSPVSLSRSHARTREAAAPRPVGTEHGVLLLEQTLARPPVQPLVAREHVRCELQARATELAPAQDTGRGGDRSGSETVFGVSWVAPPTNDGENAKALTRSSLTHSLTHPTLGQTTV